MIQKAWKQSPHMAIHMGERFKISSVQIEISRLVRAEPRAVIDVPEALHFLLGDRLEPDARNALRVSASADYLSSALIKRSGFHSGQPYRLSLRWSTFSHDTATTH